MVKKTARRDYGTGTVYQRCDTKRHGCPPAEPVTTDTGKTVKRRPEHKCTAIWVGMMDLGWEYAGTDANGAPKYRRIRKPVYGATKIDVVKKLREIDTTTAVTAVPTVGQWLTRWLDEIIVHKVTPNAMAGYRWAVHKYLIPNIGRWPMDKLTPGHVQQLHETLRKTRRERRTAAEVAAGDQPGYLSKTSIQQIHACLSAALTDAEPFDYLPPRGNPAARIDAPGRGDRELPELDAEQAAKLLRAVADDPMGSRWAFALLTACRKGEAIGLRWSHVHLDQDIPYARVAWQLQRIKYRHGCDKQRPSIPADIPACGRRFAGDCPKRELDVREDYEYEQLNGGLCLCRPKAGSRRVVPLVPSLVAWLRRHRDEQGDPGPYDLVWSRQGRPIDPRADWQAWLDLLKEHDLPQVRLHSARHTCVSLLYALQIQEVFIQQIAGHTTAAMTRKYRLADLGPASAALAQLDAHLRRPQLTELRPAVGASHVEAGEILDSDAE